MKGRKVFIFFTILIALCAFGLSAADAPKELPRNETLYINGLQWGPPANFNPLSTNAAFPVGYVNNYLLVYETLFMFNQLTGQSEPLLGKSFAWTDKLSLKVELNPAAKWNDGKDLNAADVVYSYMAAKRYALPWSAYMDYIDSVTAQGDSTVLIKLNPAKPNRLYALDSLNKVYIVPQHVWEPIESQDGKDITKISQEFNANPVGSGAYKVMFYDDTRIICQRDDNYWGKALFGKLPAPKYIAHMIYKSNDAGTNAFRQHEVDVSQQFINKVWDLWKKGEPYKTYLDKIPYYLPGGTPSITFNMTKKGLGDNVEVRRAIAMCIDYKKIAEVAMSNYSDQVVPGIILQTPSEKPLVDESAVKSLWYKQDAAAANKLLDSIGAMKGADGIRVLKDGTRLGPWDVSCPYGWSDWNASLEIVVQSAKKIGIDLRTKFPEFPVWYNDVKNGNFDICMWSTTNPGVAQPWDRARDKMDSTGVPPIGQPVVSNSNFGRYKNARADELIDKIPQETDQAKLKEMYTELDKIFLTDLPIVQLMYRPSLFYTVYEGVWKGLPDSKSNPSNVPPTPEMGSFIKALYNISAK
jgi:peptide/nickel transport system substrate-binding protein